MKLHKYISETTNYNFHTHTQFCDGKDSMLSMAESATEVGLDYLGFTPHAPISCQSPCNMSFDRVDKYFNEFDKVCQWCAKRSDMRLLKSMEIDYLSKDFGPHIDYFQKMPLDYILASVHFVPSQDGIPIDCDGRFNRFNTYLTIYFKGDLRYVVEKYFEQVLTMMELGGFDVLGHFDKIALNASLARPGIETEHWYESLVDDVISHIESSNVIVEVNTKAFEEHKRLYPSQLWISKLLHKNLPIMVNSDAHYKDKIISGREDAFSIIKKFKDELCK